MPNAYLYFPGDSKQPPRGSHGKPEGDMFVEDGLNRGQGFGLSIHGLVTGKLSLPAREIEGEAWVRPVPRSGASLGGE